MSDKEDEDYETSKFVFIFICEDEIIIDHKTKQFPCKGVSSNASHSWNEIAINIAKKVFNFDQELSKDHDNEHDSPSIESFAKSSKLIRMLRLWFPLPNNKHTFLQRYTLFKKLDSSARSYIKVQGRFSWIAIKNLQLDPEQNDLITLLQKSPNDQIGFLGKEITADEFIFDPSVKSLPSRRTQSILMAAAQFSQDDQVVLYHQFFSKTFPYFYLTFAQFEALMVKLGWNRDQLVDLFHSFQSRPRVNAQDKYLSYPEFVTGLAACQPTTPHGDSSGEARCRYIFRYYDKNHDGKLEFNEFLRMVKDIREARGDNANDEEVQKEAENSAKVFGAAAGPSETLTLSDFLSGVGQLKFRGTSALLRSPTSALEVLDDLNDTDSNGSTSPPRIKRRKKNEENFDPCEHLKQSVTSEAVEEMSLGCSEEDYEFATHVVKVKRSGQIIDVSSLWEMENGAVSVSSYSPNQEKFSFGRMDSIRAFNTGSEANEMLRGLRYFERGIQSKDPKLSDKPVYSWGPVDMRTVANALIDLSKEARAIFLQEPRLLKLKAPTYVLGDVHGNFRDLVCFEKALWRLSVTLTPSNFLFLGDYVDRGAHGVEVVAYLFSQKIIAPNKFHLLRGNHEHRRIQENFTFYTECLEKFGNGELAHRVWNAVNSAFDAMPIAALVDSKIFCVHGGIPPPWMAGGGHISYLDKVSNSIRDPEEEEPLVWEYLWNDPLPHGLEMPPDTKVDRHGFVPNFRRGTGHLFSDKALTDFLTRNQLSHVIRAHEVKETGFQVQHGRKLLTVFSSSHYCNGSNDAATVLIDNKKLRLIRLDTS